MTGEVIATFLFWWLLLLGVGFVIVLLVKKIMQVAGPSHQKNGLDSALARNEGEQPGPAEALAVPVAPSNRDEPPAGPRRYIIGKGVVEPGEESGAV